MLISSQNKNMLKIRGIIQNACSFLFSTVLNKMFYIKYVFLKNLLESLHTLDSYSVVTPEKSFRSCKFFSFPLSFSIFEPFPAVAV